MADWYVSKSGKTQGPFSPQQLVQLAAEQKIGPQTEVRMGESGTWIPAEEVKGLFVPAQAAVGTVPPLVSGERPASPTVAPNAVSSADEEELLKVHPSMFRNKPIKFLTLLIIGVAGLALAMTDPLARYQVQVQNSRLICLAVGLGTALIVGIAFLLWWLRYRRVSLTITNKWTILQAGLLSRYVKDVRHADVRMIVVKQGSLQRLLGVGSIAVASAATGESDIDVGGLPHPDKIKELIDGFRI
jgi:membrane protein YdbS with pleckstrin-like domain